MDPLVFKKISTGADPDFTLRDKQIEFELNSSGKRIQYFNVQSAFLDQFLASLGEHSRHFYSSYVRIEADVPAHTDIVDSVSLNFYIEAGGYKTSFYKSNGGPKQTYADHGDGHVYLPDDLEELDSFIASPGDVYLLNGKVIHGVAAGQGTRQFLQLSTNDLDYQQVLDILKC